MKTERGVSVLELIVALAIGGVLTLMALPYLQRYMALRDMRQTARLLGADLRLTQQYAVTQNQTFRLQYTAASAQYTLLRTSDATVFKVVAVPSSVAITTRMSLRGRRHRSPARYKCQLPFIRRCVCRVRPPENSMSRCFPTDRTF